MNSLLESGYITEMLCGSNFSYILQDNTHFLSTEYKVLLSQANSCFVRCMKMQYNGKIQLYYLTQNTKPLSSMIQGITAPNFLTLVANLFSDIVDVKHNGFLSCQNIDISFDRIYIDPTTFKVHLVYLPLSTRLFNDAAHFENELRTSLVRLISKTPSLSSPQLHQLSADLSNGTLSLEDLLGKFKGGRRSRAIDATVTHHTVRIIAMNAPEKTEFIINKDSYLLGKNPSGVDGVISFNKMVSRIHCKITRQGSTYQITDLQSANGTFINRIRLHPNQPHPIKDGDVIRLANSDFQVKIT